MLILCTICSDLVNAAESLYVTKCGHIFHHHCLAQWIERSKSCPQCRHKVTERCMFRIYPTVSEGSREDAAALQSRLDHAMLELRSQQAAHKGLQDKLLAATADLNKKDESLAAAERRLAAREAAAEALREQLQYAREAGRDAERLRHENATLTKTLNTLDGLQRVLAGAAGEAEAMLRGYSDLRTVATFAAALKRALCESESKKRTWRSRQLAAAQQLAEQRARHDELLDARRQMEEKLVDMERKYEALKHKRKASEETGARAAKMPRPPSPAPAPAPASPPLGLTELNDAVVSEDNISFGSLVARIEQADSPYLSLRHSGLALCALQRRAPPPGIKPSELALLSAGATSIFRRKGAAAGGAAAPPGGAAPPGEAYDGLGGHSRPDPFPRPSPRLAPRLSAKHRLRRPAAAAAPAPAPAPAGSRDIGKMFEMMCDKQVTTSDK